MSWNAYCTNPRLPKLMTRVDIIQHITNQEMEAMHEDSVREIPKYEAPRLVRKNNVMAHTIQKLFFTLLP